MIGRIAGVLTALVVLAGLGAAAGYLVGRDDAVEPTTFAVPQAVPAESPSFPVNVYDVSPDPTTAPLASDLPLHEEKFRSGGFALRAPAPDGWLRVELPGRSQWNFSVVDNPSHTYVLRIGIIAGERKTPGVETLSRIVALRAQESDGNSANLIVEDQSDTGFTATLIDSDGFQRVAIERFLTMPGDTSAYYTVAVNGREADREAMVALVDEVIAGAYVP